MVVVMAADAEKTDVDGVVERVREAGGDAFVSRGVSRTIVGLVGDIDQLDTLNLRSMPGVSDVVRITAPYKLVSREHHQERSVIRVARGADRPGHADRHRRAVRGRDRRADAGVGADGQGGRGGAAARRRVQAAQLAVRVPGTGRGRAEDPGRRAGGDRPADRDRGGRPGRRRSGRQLRGHAAGRHPQHAELPAAAGGRRRRQAGHAQARHERHHRGMADGRRVHRPARQPRHRAVRARHPDLREGHQEHAGHQRGPGRAAAVAPAGDRRPVAFRRPPGPGGTAVPGRDRGRRRRHHRRRPPAPGDRPVRRPAGAGGVGPARAGQRGRPPVAAGRPDPDPGARHRGGEPVPA